MKGSLVTKSQLSTDLRALGVTAGQTIMLHSSMKRLGWIVGGPNVVIESILDILTPTGTLMMFVSWEDNPYDLQRWPREWQDAYLAECPVYDANASRADHRAMGILAEYLRTWPGAVRSHHPFSYAAVGANAQTIVADHPLHYRDGENSPLAKLCGFGGKVLLLGPLFENITLLHHAEHLAKVPNKRKDRYKMPMMQAGERVWVEIEEYDTTTGIVDWPDDYFVTIMQAYTKAGYATRGQVGHADSYLFDAEHLKQYGIAWLEENLTTGQHGE